MSGLAAWYDTSREVGNGTENDVDFRVGLSSCVAIPVEKPTHKNKQKNSRKVTVGVIFSK